MFYIAPLIGLIQLDEFHWSAFLSLFLSLFLFPALDNVPFFPYVLCLLAPHIRAIPTCIRSIVLNLPHGTPGTVLVTHTVPRGTIRCSKVALQYWLVAHIGTGGLRCTSRWPL